MSTQIERAYQESIEQKLKNKRKLEAQYEYEKVYSVNGYNQDFGVQLKMVF